MRDYQRALTQSEHNRMERDETQFDKVNQRTSKFFTKRDVNP